MLGRPGFDATRHAVQAFVEQCPQRPAGAIAGEHVQVVNMQGALAVGLANLGAVNLVKPIVGGDLAGYVKHQTTKGIALVSVGLHAPVFTG